MSVVQLIFLKEQDMQHDHAHMTAPLKVFYDVMKWA